MDGVLSVTGTPSDTHVISFVDTEVVSLPNGVFSIYDTSQLGSFLGILGDDINLKVEESEGRAVAFRLDDKPSGGTTKVQFVLSDPGVIPKESVEAYDKLVPFDVTIDFDADFMTQFVRAKGAFSDLPGFTVVQDGDKTSFVLGFDADMLTSQVDMEVNASGTLSEPMSFSSDYLKSIFQVNKEAKGGTIGISSKGAMFITFANDVFNVRYYLLKVNKSQV